MRVVAGTHRGRTLRTPLGNGTRPTSDRVREAVFSILGEIDGANVLDLFAGSGALGIEALSRGAASAAFVDTAPAAVAAVKANLKTLGFDGVVVKLPALRAITCTPIASRLYDLVFLDPPYRLASDLGPELSQSLPYLLAVGGRVVTESDRRSPLELALPLQLERQYGDTLIRIHDTR